jgi:hypothetical protein
VLRRSPQLLRLLGQPVPASPLGRDYALLHALRSGLERAKVAPMRLATLRLALLKIGGRIDEYADRIRLRLASNHPGQALWPVLGRYPRRRE